MRKAATSSPIELLPLERIKTTNRYLRLDTKIEDLKRSIDGIGLISPLVVNGNDELIAGGRRYSALKELGMEAAPVVRVQMNALEQELLSIDENLMRKALSGLELEAALRRGKEVYDALFGPEEEEAPAPAPEPESEEAPAPAKRKGFVAEAAEKTGMSERAIQAAITREESSAPDVKEARRSGELGVRSTTELVALPKDDQTRLLPYIRGKTFKEAQELLRIAREESIEAAVAQAERADEHASDFHRLREGIARVRKLAESLQGNEAAYSGGDADAFQRECRGLAELLQGLADAAQS